MKFFFDTSVLVASLLTDHEHHQRSFTLLARANRQNSCCAAHSLAELYATLTRLPGKFGLSVDQVLLSLESVEERLELISLQGSEYQRAIRDVAVTGIVGGTIFDALLGRCAVKAGATTIYTWNIAHFKRLGDEVAKKVRTP